MAEKHLGEPSMTEKHLREPSMTEKHPGGGSMTRHLIALSQITPCRILDMGAGDGHGVRLLREMGFDAVGIDASPNHNSDHIIQGDFLHCPFDDCSFDAILSECAFYVSGNPQAAMREAARLLKKGGTLLLADVSYQDLQGHGSLLQSAGFSVRYLEDITPLWKEYYISCIWNGTADEWCACLQNTPVQEERKSGSSFSKKKCSYYLTICERM